MLKLLIALAICLAVGFIGTGLFNKVEEKIEGEPWFSRGFFQGVGGFVALVVGGAIVFAFLFGAMGPNTDSHSDTTYTVDDSYDDEPVEEEEPRAFYDTESNEEKWEKWCKKSEIRMRQEENCQQFR